MNRTPVAPNGFSPYSLPLVCLYRLRHPQTACAQADMSSTTRMGSLLNADVRVHRGRH
jgi:hypothetical protein